LGRLPPYVLRIAFRLAEGVAGYVEASREARCWQKGAKYPKSFLSGKRTVERSNDRFGFKFRQEFSKQDYLQKLKNYRSFPQKHSLFFPK